MLKVSYSGTLEDGTTFDTATEEEPFSFPLGVDDVIKARRGGGPRSKAAAAGGGAPRPPCRPAAPPPPPR